MGSSAYKTRKVNGRTEIRYEGSARWIDVTGIDSKRYPEIRAGFSKGGSKGGQDVAARLQGKKPGEKPPAKKPPAPSGLDSGLGNKDKPIGTNFNDPKDVASDQDERNIRAAEHTVEVSNPISDTDIYGNSRTTKFDANGRPVITTKAGGLVSALMGTNQEAIARENTRLGKSAYGSGDTSADRKRVEDGLVSRYDEVYAPQFQQEKTDLDSQLINRGFVPGSEAYNKQMFELDRRQKDAKSQYVSQALDKGASELKNLTDIDNSQRTQVVNEGTALGGQMKAFEPKDFTSYKGATVNATNGENIYGSTVAGTTSRANTEAAIKAKEEQDLRDQNARNAERDGANKGDPNAGSGVGKGFGDFANGQGASTKSLGQPVTLPGSVIAGAGQPPAPNTNAPTQRALPGGAIQASQSAGTSNLPSGASLPGAIVGQSSLENQFGTTPPNTNAPLPGSLPGNIINPLKQAPMPASSTAPSYGGSQASSQTMGGPTPTMAPHTPGIGTTLQANINPKIKAKMPIKSTIGGIRPHNPFGNKTGFLAGRNKNY